MTNAEYAAILELIAQDLCDVAEVLRSDPQADIVRELALATVGFDEASRRVACGNVAVGAAIADTASTRQPPIRIVTYP